MGQFNKDTELKIAEYLQQHSDFFERHQELIENLIIPHSKKGTLSLVEMQLERQRQKINKLEQDLASLTRLAEYNSEIFFSLMPLQQELSQCKNLEQGIQTLNKWAISLYLKGAKILLLKDSWSSIPQLAEKYWLDRKAFEIIRLERLGLRRFYLGTLTHKEKTLLFLNEEFPIGSVACCLIGKNNNQPNAIVLFTSLDEEHFYPQQDTLFLQELCNLLERQLYHWIGQFQK